MRANYYKLNYYGELNIFLNRDFKNIEETPDKIRIIY